MNFFEHKIYLYQYLWLLLAEFKSNYISLAVLFVAAFKALNNTKAAIVFIKVEGSTTDINNTLKLAGKPTVIKAVYRNDDPLTIVPITAVKIIFT